MQEVSKNREPSRHSALKSESFAGYDRSDLARLSEAEVLQLGTPHGSSRFVSAEEWPAVREQLLARDQRRNPLLRPELAAYTPGETLRLLDHPDVRSWHREMAGFKVPRATDLIVFVPCAATKPWSDARRGIYTSYNKLRQESGKGKMPHVYFVTISEPLGVVPQKHWHDFPQYENPGLFRSSAQRSGMFNAEWKEKFGKHLITPFDEEAYQLSIQRLADVIRIFLENNHDRARGCLAFVDNLPGQGLGTHSDMLLHADPEMTLLPEENRHTKRAAPRQKPYEHLRKEILRTWNSLKD